MGCLRKAKTHSKGENPYEIKNKNCILIVVTYGSETWVPTEKSHKQFIGTPENHRKGVNGNIVEVPQN